MYIVHISNEFSHVVSYPYGTYQQTTNKGLIVRYVAMGIMKFQEQAMAWSHCLFSAFEQLQIFGECFNFFQMAEKFCQVRKSIFCTFGKRRVVKKIAIWQSKSHSNLRRH